MVKSLRDGRRLRATAKLIDLERSIHNNSSARVSQPALQCPFWMAPELITTGMPSRYSDVYALSIVVWEVLVGQVPFANLRETRIELANLIEQGLRPSITSLVPETIAFMLYQIWTDVPSARPSANDLQQVLQDVLSGFNRSRAMTVTLEPVVL